MTENEEDSSITTLVEQESLISAIPKDVPVMPSTHIDDTDLEEKQHRLPRQAMKPGTLLTPIDETPETLTTKEGDQPGTVTVTPPTTTTENKESRVDVPAVGKVTENDIKEKPNTSKVTNETCSTQFAFQEEEHTTNSSDEFDSFILQNVEPFSGKGNVSSWLDQTDALFNAHSIGRHARFDSISLLVEGEVKRKYMKNRSKIQNYDDFYEFLLNEYDHSDEKSHSNKTSHTLIHDHVDIFTSIAQKDKSNDSHIDHSDDSTFVNRTNQSLFSNSNIVANNDVTNLVGEKSASKMTTVTNNLSSSFIDPTLHDIRKAIVADLIKNPKTFKGSKDDVKKWLEDIEHLLKLHISKILLD